MSDNLKELILRIEEKLEQKIDKLEAQLEKVWEQIDKLKNRPPIWVTFMFMILSALIGWLAR